jgi:hypothetical protein
MARNPSLPTRRSVLGGSAAAALGSASTLLRKGSRSSPWRSDGALPRSGGELAPRKRDTVAKKKQTPRQAGAGREHDVAGTAVQAK